MKLKIRDIEANEEKVVETNYIHLVEVRADSNNDGNDQLFQWVWPSYFDDKFDNSNLKICQHGYAGSDTERVINVEVGVGNEIDSYANFLTIK